ncbi:MAG: BAX protein [Fusobacteriales bacterium]|nr:MAG: BAX protein [Fusobacteriales bacterium]
MRKVIILGIFIFTSLSFFVTSNSKTTSYKVEKSSIKIEQAKDFKKSKNKKKIFIETLIPIINEIENGIQKEKVTVKILLAKKINNKKINEKEEKFLDEMLKKYKVKNAKLETLISKMVVPPKSFILGQAAFESGWGRSKLAGEANNLFGMRSFTKDSTKSVKVGKNQYYKRYKNIQDSVEEYILTLARHTSYSDLRKAIGEGKDSVKLIKYLANYSEVKNIYAKRLKTIIINNNLTKYDKK